jgi:hypothetical protein
VRSGRNPGQDILAVVTSLGADGRTVDVDLNARHRGALFIHHPAGDGAGRGGGFLGGCGRSKARYEKKECGSESNETFDGHNDQSSVLSVIQLAARLIGVLQAARLLAEKGVAGFWSDMRNRARGAQTQRSAEGRWE